MSSKVKKIICMLVFTVLLINQTLVASAAENNEVTEQENELLAAYERIIEYSERLNIPVDLSFDTFVEEFIECGCTISEYENLYYDTLKINRTTRSSIGSKWYYDTGEALPQKANYSKYNLISNVKKGDILYESKGGFGITGHIAIVEGIYYSSIYKQYYIRVVEAISSGVKRGVLDDDRIDDKDGSILRVSSATSSKMSLAVSFCVGQLNKNYMIDFKKDTSATEKDWYCSELVWAGYYIQGIDIETTGLYNEPGITPRDINNSTRLAEISFN